MEKYIQNNSSNNTSNDKTPLLFLGDVHGEFDLLIKLLQKTGIENSTIIQVGDFGVGFPKQKQHTLESTMSRTYRLLQRLDNVLGELGCTLSAIRGNHDNPAVWDYVKTDITNPLKNIDFISDNSLLSINGYKIYFVGGAISIDKQKRTEGLNYWANEGVSPYDFEQLNQIDFSTVDIIVTHTSPAGFFPYASTHDVFGRLLPQDAIEERNQMNVVLKDIIEKSSKGTDVYWYYGHFHDSVSGVYKNIKFRCLDISEFYEHRYNPK